MFQKGTEMKEESRKFQTRRDFLQSAALAGTTLILSPMISADQDSNETQDDINVALIGAGSQGQVLLNACRNIPGIRFKALCDIWENYNRKRTARIFKAYGHEVNQYEDYKQMLAEEKDLDAAIIATPDFCHAEQTIACLKAGLHVYCESEMSNTIEDAKKMVQAAKQTGKLLQIGRQRRSNPRYLHCYEKLIKEYELFGQFKAINGQWNRTIYNSLGWPEGYSISLEKLNKYGYKSMEQFRNWKWYKGLGSGPVVDLGSHQFDVYNWFLEATPKAITANGRINFHKKYGYEWYDTIMILCEYETSNGSVSAFYQVLPYDVNFRTYEKFIGNQGTFWISEYNSRDMIYPERIGVNSSNWIKCINEGQLTASEETLKEIARRPESFEIIFIVDETPLPIQKNDKKEEFLPVVREKPSLHLPVTMSGKPYHQPHLENFFDTIRGKAQLNCPAEVGYKTAVTVLKINEAIETGKKLQFKPEDFVV